MTPEEADRIAARRRLIGHLSMQLRIVDLHVGKILHAHQIFTYFEHTVANTANSFHTFRHHFIHDIKYTAATVPKEGFIMRVDQTYYPLILGHNM